MEAVTAKKTTRKFSETKLNDFTKHYPAYFRLTAKGKRSLAASLDVPIKSLSRWMVARRKREKEMALRTNECLITYEQQQDKNVSGMHVNIMLVL